MSEQRLCKFCNEILVQKERENSCNFKLRKYCNVKCARDKDKARGHWREPNWVNPRVNSFAVKE